VTTWLPTIEEATVICILLVAYRIRGDRTADWQKPMLFQRPVWASAVMGCVAYIHDTSLAQLAVVWVSAYLAMFLPHAEGQDMGTVRGDVETDFLMRASAEGWRMVLTLAPVLPVYSLVYGALVASTLVALGYLGAMRRPTPRRPLGLEVGEIAAGAAWGLYICYAMKGERYVTELAALL
jgi:hypothetical protein